MVKAIVTKGIGQSLGNVILANDFVERLRAPFTCYDLIRQKVPLEKGLM